MQNNRMESDIPAGLLAAVVKLDLQPRGQRWSSLSFVILDAVWSIGARYDSVVVPVVERVAKHFAIADLYVQPGEAPIADPLPLSTFAKLSVDELTALTNTQRTSTQSGILKADAVLRHVKAFQEHGVEDYDEAIAMMRDDSRFPDLNAALRKIPGEGGQGIRRGYLWMLLGDDDLIKPDRMVLRWLNAHGVAVDPAGARTLIADLAVAATDELGRDITPWEIDHAMWLAARRR